MTNNQNDMLVAILAIVIALFIVCAIGFNVIDAEIDKIDAKIDARSKIK